MCGCGCGGYLDVLERGIDDLIVVRETVELQRLQVEEDMMPDLDTHTHTPGEGGEGGKRR